MQLEATQRIAKDITDAGYSGLFLAGDHSLSSAIWKNGENRASLDEIVRSNKYADLTRLLASEVLYAHVSKYPPEDLSDTMAYLYSQAIVIAADTTGPFQLSGNLWGFMYYSDQHGIKDYGVLGTHLMNVGSNAVPYLIKLLNSSDTIFYDGSQEATIGNSLRYRVKDVAAYYISKITNTPVKFHENPQDRDAEIERLKNILRSKP